MGVAEGIGLVCIGTLPPVFLTIFPFNLEKAATAAWLIPILNCLEFFVIAYLLLYVLRTTGGDLYAACEQLLGTVAARLVAVYYISLYFLDATLLLRQYAENTLTTALPQLDFQLALALYAFMVVLLVYAGIEPVARTCYIGLPWVVFGVLIVIVLTAPRYEFLFLAPWNGPGWDKVLLAGLSAGGVNLGALLPFFLAASFQNARTIRRVVLYGLGLSSLIRTVVSLALILHFGGAGGREKLLPYYELARLVYVTRLIQRVESFFIVLWAIVGMLSIAIDVYAGLYLLCRLFNLPALRPLIGPAVVIAALFALLPGEAFTVVTIYAQAYSSIYDIGTVAIPIVLFAAAVYRARRRSQCPSG
jgi:spore germination protein (amino acid permease)